MLESTKCCEVIHKICLIRERATVRRGVKGVRLTIKRSGLFFLSWHLCDLETHIGDPAIGPVPAGII
jgi:hypothetical protein